jgi:NTP pyrophosphatase (non-canonical NTP hydrolase)
MPGRSLEDLRRTAAADSDLWFPEVHSSPEYFLIHSALGLAGETGETVDVIKKWHRKAKDMDSLDRDKLGAEMADVLIYLLHISTATGIDLVAEFRKKRVINMARFGGEV